MKRFIMKVSWIAAILGVVLAALNIFFGHIRFANALFFACLRKGQLKKYCVLMAQSAHETNNWKSNVFLSTNNAFGMGVPVQRSSNRIGQFWSPSENMFFSVYRTVYDSCIDRLNWDIARLIKWKDPDDYMTRVLMKQYATDPDYKTLWTNHLKVLSTSKVLGFLPSKCSTVWPMLFAVGVFFAFSISLLNIVLRGASNRAYSMVSLVVLVIAPLLTWFKMMLKGKDTATPIPPEGQ